MTAGCRAMGSQEVLGQAARLASSGLLLQVLSAGRPRAVPPPGSAGSRLRPGSAPPLPRGWTGGGGGGGGAPGPGVGSRRSESWLGDGQQATFVLRIAVISRRAAAERDQVAGVFVVLCNLMYFKARGSSSPCSTPHPQTMPQIP